MSRTYTGKCRYKFKIFQDHGLKLEMAQFHACAQESQKKILLAKLSIFQVLYGDYF